MPSYPHVVVRWMAAVYGKRDVVFVRTAEELAAHPKAVAVLDPTPDADHVNEARRDWLLDRVRRLAAEIGKEVCVVFGPDDSVYVSPDGRTRPSRQNPSGGLRLDDVRAR